MSEGNRFLGMTLGEVRAQLKLDREEDMPNMPQPTSQVKTNEELTFTVSKKEKKTLDDVISAFEKITKVDDEIVDTVYQSSFEFFNDGIGTHCHAKIRLTTETKVYNFVVDITDFDSF